MNKARILLIGVLTGSVLIINGCGGEQNQTAEQSKTAGEVRSSQSEMAAKPAAQPKISKQTAPAKQAADPYERAELNLEKSVQGVKPEVETAVHKVQGAMTAAEVPAQPQPPADLGEKVYGQCVGCHGPQGGGGVGPKLAGQTAEQIKQKLFDYKAGKQRGPQTAMMAPMAQGLSDAEIDAVAHYIATHFK